jgi:hypothetical protein
MGPTNTSTFSKASEGLEGVPVRTFTTIKNMQGAIDSYGKLEASKASPYLIFRFVTTDDLLNIERGRECGEISRGVRMTHYVDWNILILKVPTAEHERSHRKFSDKLVIRAAGMGLEEEFDSLGATKFKTPHMSKEGDSAFKPLSIRPRKADWPTIVLEFGWSESLVKLRQDAHRWLENSGGDVKIVLLFSIGRTARTMIIERWENPVPANRPATRSMTRAAANPLNQPPQTPTQIQAITIDSNSNTVNGAPLTLEFQKIFPHLTKRFVPWSQNVSMIMINGSRS